MTEVTIPTGGPRDGWIVISVNGVLQWIKAGEPTELDTSEIEVLGHAGIPYMLDGGVEPYVVIDFKNNAYIVNGVYRLLNEVCVEDLVGWGYDFDPADIVPGVGYNASGEGPAIIGDALDFLTAGKTTLIDYALEDDSLLMQMFNTADINGTNSQWFLKASAGGITPKSHYADAHVVSEDYPVASANGDHKVAITHLNGSMSWSIDGGAVSTYATEDWTPAPDGCGIYIDSGNPGTVVRSILIYPAQADADLPTLSTL